MSVKSQREMLEAAIAADFDDLAAHAAYADLLAEEGDPRGEYIQLHLALEDANQSPRLLAQMADRANRLFRAPRRDWLGKLAPFLLGGPRTTVEPVARTSNSPSAAAGWPSCMSRMSRRIHPRPGRCARAQMLQASHCGTRGCRTTTARWSRWLDRRLLTLRSFAWGTRNRSGHGGRWTRPAIVRKMPQLRELDVRAEWVDPNELFALPFPELRALSMDFLPTFRSRYWPATGL